MLQYTTISRFSAIRCISLQLSTEQATRHTCAFEIYIGEIMTTKHIVGTYTAGYTLSQGFGAIKVSPPGLIAGAGFYAQASATFLNEGSILANTSGASGVELVGGGKVSNSMDAANGGAVGANRYDPGTFGGAGGRGGAGVILATAGSILHRGTMAGGAGGAGGYGYDKGGQRGKGGGGVVDSAANSTLTNGGLVTGGQGGFGGLTTTSKSPAGAPAEWAAA